MSAKALVGQLSSNDDKVLFQTLFSLESVIANERTRREFVQVGGLEAVSKLLYYKMPEVVSSAVNVLNSLSLCEDVRDKIGELGVMKGLIHVMKLNDDDMTAEALSCLQNLLHSESNQLQFVTELPDSIEMLVNLRNSTADVSSNSFFALANLSLFFDDIRTKIGETGGVENASKMLTANDVQLQGKAAKLLLNLSSNSVSREVIIRSALPSIIQTTRTCKNKSLLLTLTKLLINIAYYDLGRKRIDELDGTSLGFSLLQAGDIEVQIQGAKFLVNMTVSGAVRKRILRSGSIRSLESLKNCRDPNLKQHVESSLNNLAFPFEETYDESAYNFRKDQDAITKLLLNQEELRMFEQLRQQQEAKRKREEEEQRKKEEEELKKKAEEERKKAEEERKRQEELQRKKQEEERKRKEQEEKAKMMATRHNIVKEILYTENAYVKNMELVINKFMNPLLGLVDSKKEILSLAQIRQLFSNITIIVSVNSMLLEALASRINKWTNTTTRLGDLFFKLSDLLKSYSEYINNFDEATSLYNKLNTTNQEFIRFLRTRKVEQQIPLDLTAYLIQPIQRIPRYNLLLADLIKHTPENHPDYSNLLAALEKMRSIADQINKAKGENENFKKIVAIQNSLIGNTEPIFSMNRRFIKEGPVTFPYMLLFSTSGFLHLFDDMMIVSSVTRNGYEVQGTIKLVLLDLGALDEGNPTTFILKERTGTLNFTVQCASPNERQDWVNKLKSTTQNILGVLTGLGFN